LRPQNLVRCKVELIFNLFTFTELEIDLEHVNKNGRSIYGAEEVSLIVTALLSGQLLRPSGEKQFEDGYCSYFVCSGRLGDKILKLVFCICSDKPETIGVITLHRLRSKS
jgi:hypothetical protein